MTNRSPGQHDQAQRGTAAVETVILLPFLLFIAAVVISLGRGHREESRAFVDARQAAWVEGRDPDWPPRDVDWDPTDAADNPAPNVIGSALGISEVTNAESLITAMPGIAQVQAQLRWPSQFLGFYVFPNDKVATRTVPGTLTGRSPVTAPLRSYQPRARHLVVLYTAEADSGWINPFEWVWSAIGSVIGKLRGWFNLGD